MTAVARDSLVVGIGGNVGGESVIRGRFERAREALAQLGSVTSAPLYRSAPIGPAQPSFLNTAVLVRVSDATPDELISTVLMHERLLGRDRAREARNGPRAIDLDILLWGDRVLRTPELEIPHPRLGKRRFVLRPLIALFGEDVIVAGQTERLGELEQRVSAQVVDEIDSVW